jgi:hypothetical protein
VRPEEIKAYQMRCLKEFGPEISHCPVCERGKEDYTYPGSTCLDCVRKKEVKP